MTMQLRSKIYLIILALVGIAIALNFHLFYKQPLPPQQSPLSTPTPAPGESAAAAISGVTPESSLAERWGIEIVSIQQTAGGYMIDFRYRILDPEKAQPLLDKKVQPYLVDEASGAKFMVPSPPIVGAMRASGPVTPGKIFYIVFANPGKYVKVGKQVTVVIGDFKAEHLTLR